MHFKVLKEFWILRGKGTLLFSSLSQVFFLNILSFPGCFSFFYLTKGKQICIYKRKRKSNKKLVCSVLQGWLEGWAFLGSLYIIFWFSLGVNYGKLFFSFSLFWSNWIFIHRKTGHIHIVLCSFQIYNSFIIWGVSITQLFLVTRKYCTVQRGVT